MDNVNAALVTVNSTRPRALYSVTLREVPTSPAGSEQHVAFSAPRDTALNSQIGRQ